MKRIRTPLKCLILTSALCSALFGVCSVSIISESNAYPLSKSNYSSSLQSSNVETIHLTRSARETPAKAPVRQPAPESTTVNSPMAPGSHNVSLGLGQNFLLGDLGNVYENALGFQFHYNYGVSDLFAFDSDFGYSSHSNGQFSMWHLSAGLRANLIYIDQLVPFFNVGLGFYHPSYTYPTLANATASGLLFGLRLGGGLDLFLSNNVFFGTTLTWHDMFSSTKTASNGSAKELGGSFMSFMIHAGYAF